MKALILAGGLGTRLRDVVADRPKPMADAGGRPFLAYLMEQLCTQGFREIVLCVGYLADQVQSYFGDGGRWDLRVDYSVETEALGTAGAIRNAGRFVDGPFLVLNGDSYLQVDYRQVAQCQQRASEIEPRLMATVAAVQVEDASCYGTLKLDEAFRIEAFREKVHVETGWINGGAYVLEPAILEWIPRGRSVSLERETFPLLLAEGYHLLAFPASGFFVDIGTPQGYRRFQDYLEAKP